MVKSSLPTSTFLKKIQPKLAFGLIFIISLFAYIGLVAVIYGVKEPNYKAEWVRFMPWFNTFLNTLSTIFLLLGYQKVKKRNYRLHARSMIAAFICSSLFLTSYIIYHALHGDTPFTGQGNIRIFYFSILISHIIFSTFIVPGALGLFYSALSQRWVIHYKLAHWVLPIWVYVSISGIMIFIFLSLDSHSSKI